MTHTERLERRYRLLLTCYPPAHRAMYDDEMIGVLMSGTSSSQRRPRPAETLDLVVSGLRARLNMTVRTTATPAWHDAAGIFGYLASLVIATSFTGTVAAGLGWHHASRSAIALAAAWALPSIAAGLGHRRTAALAATVGAAGQTFTVARAYTNSPDDLVTSWWLVVLAVAAAAALVARTATQAATTHAATSHAATSQAATTQAVTTQARDLDLDAPEIPAPVLPADLEAPTRPADPDAPAATTSSSGPATADPRHARGRRLPLGVAPTIVAAVSAVAAGVAMFLESRTASATTTATTGETITYHVQAPVVRLPFADDDSIRSVVTGVLLALLAIIVLRLTPAIRRRVLLLAAPAAATAILVVETFGGFLASSPRFWPPVHLEAIQWTALVATPVLVFAAGAWLLARYERKLASGALLA